jgi:glycerophosphoryl diester phosphodiesterase
MNRQRTPALARSLRPCLFVLLLAAPCVAQAAPAYAPPAYDRAAAVAADIADGNGANPLVASHRADWRSAPENSLRAIRNAIAMGVDIVEIDVRRTKDGRFVIIHDSTLDRTTTGTGKVSDHTLAELLELRLRDANAHSTADRLPTLEEALAAIRGRAVVNLDKSGNHLAEIYEIVARERALEQVLFSVGKPLAEVEAGAPGLLAKIKYMVVVNDRRAGPTAALVRDYLASAHPPAVVQVSVTRGDDSPLLPLLPEIRARGSRVWINSIWPEQNGGHHDDLALTDPDGSYGWLIRVGANIIQTDRPALLIQYLRDTNRRR